MGGGCTRDQPLRSANDAVIQDAIDSRQSVYLASPTTEENLFNTVADGATVFGREPQQFVDAGYQRAVTISILRVSHDPN
jgi:hypothetical protein